MPLGTSFIEPQPTWEFKGFNPQKGVVPFHIRDADVLRWDQIQEEFVGLTGQVITAGFDETNTVICVMAAEAGDMLDVSETKRRAFGPTGFQTWAHQSLCISLGSTRFSP